MKRIFLYVITLASVFLLVSCGKHNLDNIDNMPPSSPMGLSILNGDNVVTISWNPNTERDVSGYNVYYATSYYGKYTLIGTTKNDYYNDYDAKNGYTYYYAVTAFDYDGNESDLSKENISATPRPEGLNASISDYRNYPNIAGFSFSTYTIVPYNDTNVDFYYEIYNGTSYIDLSNGSFIKDMGATNDIYDIDYAPSTGWTTDAVAIVGHTYAIWTYDNYYAKIRVSNIVGSRLIFDWAFQAVQGNTQLKISNLPAVNNRLKNKLLSRN
jgi:hypothetical protein